MDQVRWALGGAEAALKNLTFEHDNFSGFLTGVFVQGKVRYKEGALKYKKKQIGSVLLLSFLRDLKLLRTLDCRYYTLKP